MKNSSYEFHAGINDQGRRLDRVLRKMYPGLSLAWIYRSIRTGRIAVNHKRSKISYRVKAGDCITVQSNLPLPSPSAFYNESALPGLNHREAALFKSLIIFENEHVLALNKPQGMNVHGPFSLDDLVKRYLASVANDSLSFTPGPVHRLDRNTTGLIFFSRSLPGAQKLSAALKSRRVQKNYLALLDGELIQKESWTDRLYRHQDKRMSLKDTKAGKTASTTIQPLVRKNGITLALCSISSGRTHQIRAQGAIHHHPLTGDRKYGGSNKLQRYILHSIRLDLKKKDADPGFKTLFAPLPEKSIFHIDKIFGKGTSNRIMKLVRTGKTGF